MGGKGDAENKEINSVHDFPSSMRCMWDKESDRCSGGA
jgi:hypothetical protein